MTGDPPPAVRVTRRLAAAVCGHQHAEQVLLFAVDWSVATGGEVVVLYSAPSFVFHHFALISPYQHIAQWRRDHAEQTRQWVGEQLEARDCRWRIIYHEGSARTALRELAEAEPVDAMVLAACMRRVGRRMAGSAKRPQCSVLILPGPG